MVKLHFDIRDIFRVIRLGWSGKKIWVGLCGLIVAYVGYSVLVTIAHLTAGKDLIWVWHRYGLFPGASPGMHPLLGTIIDVIAILYALAVIFLTTCMICKITYQQLRGDDFYSSGDAWTFIKSNWSGVLLGPVAVLALVVFFLIAGMIIGWVAHIIPYVGEFLFALSFIPIFFAALVAVFISVALVVALMMSPAVVGTVGEDALEVVIQSFSLVWSQPWRLLIYTLWMKISVALGVAILGSLMVITFCLTNWACGLAMKAKLLGMYSVALKYVPFNFSMGDPMLMFQLFGVGTPSGSVVWAGYILAAMIILLAGVLLAYAQAAYASGISLIYVILRKLKDDENLLEWEEEGEDAPAAEPEGEDAPAAEPEGEDAPAAEPEGEDAPAAEPEGEASEGEGDEPASEASEEGGDDASASEDGEAEKG